MQKPSVHQVPGSASMTPLNFQMLFESLTGLYLILKPDFTIVAVTDGYLRATLTQRAVILGRNLFDVFPDNPDDPNATGVHNLHLSLKRVLQHKVPDTMAVQKYDVRKPDSEEFEEKYWSPINTPLLGPDNEILYIIHRVEDVTEFVRLKQEKMARDIAEGKKVVELVDAEIYLRAQEIQEVNQRMESDRKNLEQELVHAQKMEAIGNLTGGMAHDFNNLLGIIIGNLDLVLEEPDHPDSKDHIQTAIEAAVRGADLTRRLLAFARKQPLQPQRVQINELVTGLARLLGRTLGEDIEIMLRLGDDMWPVIVDPVQLEAALTNLSTNARDAMPHGGQLIIATRNVQLDEDYAARFVEVAVGPYVLIEVSDTGTGIDPEVMKRIFEPFFTTKEVGKGSGLGLSMVFGFIKQSGGHVNVYSEPGSGTTFRLYLPRAMTAAAQLQSDGTLRGQPVRGGQETILVVEDNHDMRRVACRQLSDLGYRVFEAENATAAVEHLIGGDTIDLLFTDIVMPGKINGLELAREAMARWPTLRVILTSGFPEHKLAHTDGMATGGLRLLSKPYRKEELASTLREVFDAC